MLVKEKDRLRLGRIEKDSSEKLAKMKELVEGEYDLTLDFLGRPVFFQRGIGGDDTPNLLYSCYLHTRISETGLDKSGRFTINGWIHGTQDALR